MASVLRGKDQYCPARYLPWLVGLPAVVRLVPQVGVPEPVHRLESPNPRDGVTESGSAEYKTSAPDVYLRTYHAQTVC